MQIVVWILATIGALSLTVSTLLTIVSVIKYRRDKRNSVGVITYCTKHNRPWDRIDAYGVRHCTFVDPALGPDEDYRCPQKDW